MSVSVSVETELSNITSLLDKSSMEELGYFAANEWHRLCNPFIPKNTGQLADFNVEIKPWEIEYYAPYARTVYEHNRNYHKDKHPKATAKWSEVAKISELPKLNSSLQGYIGRFL